MPTPCSPLSFGAQSVGLHRGANGDIVVTVAAPDGGGDIYATVSAEIACLIQQDLADMLHRDPNGKPRPMVPLNEKLSSYYEAGYVQRQHDGGVLMNFAEPGGDLLVKLAHRTATDLLHDLADALGFTLQRSRQVRQTNVE